MRPGLGLEEQFELVVETAGRVPFPEEVRAALGLEPGDLFSIIKNPVSLRLESHRELLAEAGAAWREEFLHRPQTAFQEDGTLEIPSDLLALPVGSRLVLEVVTLGPCHEIYLYPVED